MGAFGRAYAAPEADWSAVFSALTEDKVLLLQHRNPFSLKLLLAARYLAKHPDARRVEVVWSEEDRDVAQVQARLSEDEPLPRPPVTGWEETTLMTSEMLR